MTGAGPGCGCESFCGYWIDKIESVGWDIADRKVTFPMEIGFIAAVFGVQWPVCKLKYDWRGNLI